MSSVPRRQADLSAASMTVMRRTARCRSTAAVVAVALLIVGDAPTRAAAPSAPPQRVTRLDAKLRAALASHASEPQRVIIRVRPGSRPGLRSSLVAHGDTILGEHESIDALTAV